MCESIQSLLLSGEAIVKEHRLGCKKVNSSFGSKLFDSVCSLDEKREVRECLDDILSKVSQARVERDNCLSLAEWCPNIKKALITRFRCKSNCVFGHAKKSKLYLYPEEALFMLESNSLILIYKSLQLSVESAYNLLLGKDSDCDLIQYKVYSNLCRLGYKLLRHGATNQCKSPEEQRQWSLLGKHSTDSLSSCTPAVKIMKSGCDSSVPSINQNLSNSSDTDDVDAITVHSSSSASSLFSKTGGVDSEVDNLLIVNCKENNFLFSPILTIDDEVTHNDTTLNSCLRRFPNCGEDDSTPEDVIIIGDSSASVSPELILPQNNSSQNLCFRELPNYCGDHDTVDDIITIGDSSSSVSPKYSNISGVNPGHLYMDTINQTLLDNLDVRPFCLQTESDDDDVIITHVVRNNLNEFYDWPYTPSKLFLCHSDLTVDESPKVPFSKFKNRCKYQYYNPISSFPNFCSTPTLMRPSRSLLPAGSIPKHVKYKVTLNADLSWKGLDLSKVIKYEAPSPVSDTGTIFISDDEDVTTVKNDTHTFDNGLSEDCCPLVKNTPPSMSSVFASLDIFTKKNDERDYVSNLEVKYDLYLPSVSRPLISKPPNYRLIIENQDVNHKMPSSLDLISLWKQYEDEVDFLYAGVLGQTIFYQKFYHPSPRN